MKDEACGLWHDTKRLPVKHLRLDASLPSQRHMAPCSVSPSARVGSCWLAGWLT